MSPLKACNLEAPNMSKAISDKAALYLSFITHKSAREINLRLEPAERIVIELIAPKWLAGNPVTVMSVLSMNYSGISNSTVFRRLKSLREKGMLTLEHDAHDTRIKYVKPTPILIGMFAILADAMSAAVHPAESNNTEKASQ